MKYDYMVKYGGQYYAAGEDVPCQGEAKKPDETPDTPVGDGKTTAESEEPGENNEAKKPGRKPKAAGQ